MSDLNLGIIGNCNFSALVDSKAKIVWSCLPHLDSDPVFNALVNTGPADGVNEAATPADTGFFSIELEGAEHSEQHYEENTAVLVTTVRSADGAEIEIIDFAPRFHQFDRTFRPATIIRRVRRIAGNPRITVRLRPTFEYGAHTPQVTRGSNHIRFIGPDQVIRLTTNAPPSYILDERPFLVERSHIFMLGEDASLTGSIEQTTRTFLDNTRSYWRDWSQSLSIPFEYQEAVIRASITLKLCTFEETGAVIAAMTTSIPEASKTERNWDYRYCWLRDSYFVIHAFNRLSATRSMENYLSYIANIVTSTDGHDLQPLYTINLRGGLEERTVDALAGYRGHRPVRVGNEAYLQQQNDVYGSVILSITQVFFDRRLTRRGDVSLFHQLEPLGQRAVELFDTPDAGLWELRTRASVHTFSAVMCWAAADRLARIAQELGLREAADRWAGESQRMHAVIESRSWNEELGAYAATFDGDELDASQLLLHELGFVAADNPRFVSTVDVIGANLRHGDHMFRYINSDDFGFPETAFTICTFWYIAALAAIGRRDEARELFEKMLGCRTSLGLLSEDIDHQTGELWGNFPQTYSMVGLITCAMRLSRPWEDVC